MPTLTATPTPNTCRWISRDLDEGLALLEVTVSTKRGPSTTRYWVERIIRSEVVVGYKLTKMDGTKSYHVSVGQRWSCSCRDFEFRHAAQGGECKHGKATRSALSRLYV